MDSRRYRLIIFGDGQFDSYISTNFCRNDILRLDTLFKNAEVLKDDAFKVELTVLVNVFRYFTDSAFSKKLKPTNNLSGECHQKAIECAFLRHLPHTYKIRRLGTLSLHLGSQHR